MGANLAGVGVGERSFMYLLGTEYRSTDHDPHLLHIF